MGFHQQQTMWLWRNPDNVTRRQLLSIDQVWRRSTAVTWSRWGCRRLADNIWLLAHDNNNNTQKLYDCTVLRWRGVCDCRGVARGGQPQSPLRKNYKAKTTYQYSIYNIHIAHKLQSQLQWRRNALNILWCCKSIDLTLMQLMTDLPPLQHADITF